MAKKEITYAEALSEVEKILTEMNDDNLDIDTLAARVKRASELIGLCREKLRKAEEEVRKVLEEEA